MLSAGTDWCPFLRSPTRSGEWQKETRHRVADDGVEPSGTGPCHVSIHLGWPDSIRVSCIESSISPIQSSRERLKSVENTGEIKWAVLDSNQWPQRCQRCALTNWANRPFFQNDLNEQFSVLIEGHRCTIIAEKIPLVERDTLHDPIDCNDRKRVSSTIS